MGCTKEHSETTVPYEVILENHLSYPEEEKIPAQYLAFETEADWEAFLPEMECVNPDRAEKLRALELNFGRNVMVLVIGEFYN